MIPVCQVHQQPMREGKKPGTFFCPKKMPDGSYCTQKANGAPAQAPPFQQAAPAQYAPATVAGTDPARHLLMLGALDAAGKVYQGTGDAIGFAALASKTYYEWKELL